MVRDVEIEIHAAVGVFFSLVDFVEEFLFMLHLYKFDVTTVLF